MHSRAQLLTYLTAFGEHARDVRAQGLNMCLAIITVHDLYQAAGANPRPKIEGEGGGKRGGASSPCCRTGKGQSSQGCRVARAKGSYGSKEKRGGGSCCDPSEEEQMRQEAANRERLELQEKQRKLAAMEKEAQLEAKQKELRAKQEAYIHEQIRANEERKKIMEEKEAMRIAVRAEKKRSLPCS